MTVAREIECDQAMTFGEMGYLGTPVSGIAAPAVDEYQGGFAGAKDFISDGCAVTGNGDIRPVRFCLVRQKAVKRMNKQTR